ncbi:MAG: hypothetical protein HC793_00545 [Aquincola sp.]|nr:hypothetical protein [Aquincola sp.]
MLLPSNWDTLTTEDRQALLEGEVQTLNAAEAAFFLPEGEDLPEDWDTLSVEQREAQLGSGGRGPASDFEGWR